MALWIDELARSKGKPAIVKRSLWMEQPGGILKYLVPFLNWAVDVLVEVLEAQVTVVFISTAVDI